MLKIQTRLNLEIAESRLRAYTRARLKHGLELCQPAKTRGPDLSATTAEAAAETAEAGGSGGEGGDGGGGGGRWRR